MALRQHVFGAERLQAFSDAVFAIVTTIMVSHLSLLCFGSGHVRLVSANWCHGSNEPQCPIHSLACGIVLQITCRDRKSLA